VTLPSVILVWIILEGRLLIVLPLIVQLKRALRTETRLKYYLIQLSSRIIFLMLRLQNWEIEAVASFILVFKLGLAPLFFWVPHIFNQQSWIRILILRTLIKLPGLLLVVNFIAQTLLLCGALRALIGSLRGRIINRLKLLFAYSRVRHTGWNVLAMLNGARWLLYWGLYSLILTSATWILSQSKVKRINQVNETPTRPIRVALLSLRGVPPLLGFGLKIMALSSVLTVRPVLGLILLLGLTVALYFYLRMFLFSWLKISSPSTKTRASKGHFIRGSVNLRGLLLLCQYGRIWCNSFRCYLWIILLTTRVII